jgi:hypothetical protein
MSESQDLFEKWYQENYEGAGNWGWTYNEVKESFEAGAQSQLQELRKKIKELYNEEDSEDYKNALFDVLGTIAEIDNLKEE